MNRLANETSPYLLQHQHNPVDWFPWGEEAFELARSTNRPIMLSVGYSACHWCHVMERESFENEEIAALMNRLFVSVKVDREERPDVDSIYMSAVQVMTGQGGWPMTVFLTPDGRPFFGGTYFPNEDRGGLPSFPRVLESVSEAYHDPERKEQLLSTSSQVISHIESLAAVRQSHEPLTADLVDNAALSFQRQFDPQNGGMGMQPKFPQPMDYELLLRHWRRTGDENSLNMVITTLEKMARGGIYDQIGGGFARYSVDTFWLVPHFEKMLYDNSQLALLYLHGWQATGNPLFKRVVEETLFYVLREMTHPDGGFFSAQDADSEGEEGKFYVWLQQDIDSILGPEQSRTARGYWGVSREGNFEGKNILNVPQDALTVASELGISGEELEREIADAREKLYAERSKRVWPSLDDKVLTSWNALMLKAFAECGAALGVREWTDAARKNANFLLTNMHLGDRLRRTWKDGSSSEPGARLNGYLEDYAMLVDGLLTLYEATFEPRWFDAAKTIADEMIGLFWSYDDAVFFDTGNDHEELVVRPRDIFDNAIPSGGSTAALALLRLAVFTGDPAYQRTAAASLRAIRDLMVSTPQGTAHWINAVDAYATTPQEVVVVGDPSDARTAALIETARKGYWPNRVLAGSGGRKQQGRGIDSPLLEDRPMLGGLPTAFVCENYACQLPVTDADALAMQLV
jgi:uncharacterized protein YyaL (SSP411 family)